LFRSWGIADKLLHSLPVFRFGGVLVTGYYRPFSQGHIRPGQQDFRQVKAEFFHFVQILFYGSTLPLMNNWQGRRAPGKQSILRGARRILLFSAGFPFFNITISSPEKKEPGLGVEQKYDELRAVMKKPGP